MLHDVHLDNLRRAFAAQFEPNEGGYLYRHAGKGAPVQVTTAERDAFVATFDRRMRWAARAILLGTIALLGGVMIATAGGEMPDRWFYTLVAALSLGMLAFYYWLRAAPARALARRPVLGNARSSSEIQQRLLTALSWQILAIGAGAAIVLIVVAISDEDRAAELRIPAIAFGVAMLALFAVQGARKWSDRRRP